MAAPRIYIAENALTVTAFPISDDIGYVVRVGDGDHEGVYLGAVFREDHARWVAYAPTDDAGPSELLGSGADLDELMTQCFLRRVRLTDDLDW